MLSTSTERTLALLLSSTLWIILNLLAHPWAATALLNSVTNAVPSPDLIAKLTGPIAQALFLNVPLAVMHINFYRVVTGDAEIDWIANVGVCGLSPVIAGLVRWVVIKGECGM